MKRQLDLRFWHPLDHWPGSRRCRGFYGGWRHHVQLSWQYQRREQLLGPVRRWTLCCIGNHAQIVRYHCSGEQEVIRPGCRHCGWTRLPSERDIDRFRDLRRRFDGR